MRSWLPAVALGLAVAVVAIVAVLALRPVDGASPSARADAIAEQLRCPDCQGLSVADSPTAAAREIRRQVDEMIAAGASDDEVRARFVERYGDWILLAPSSPLAWLVPFAVVLAGIAGLGWWLTRRAPAGEPLPEPPSEEDRRRVREEVEVLDA